MTQSIRREIVLAQPPQSVWRALTDREILAKWMYPNDFEPRAGHAFTFRVPANPQAGFDGVIHCEVLVSERPHRLTYSWAAGPVVGTQVNYQLEAAESGTRLSFEHSGFDLSQPWGEQALRGAEFGWSKMLEALSSSVAGLPAGRP